MTTSACTRVNQTYVWNKHSISQNHNNLWGDGGYLPMIKRQITTKATMRQSRDLFSDKSNTKVTLNNIKDENVK